MLNRRRLFLLLAFLSAVYSSASASPPTVKGRLEHIGPFRVLRVWGTPEEMGFAHGYMMADGILRVMHEQASAIPQEKRREYDGFTRAVLPFVDMPDRTMQELRGILAGIHAAKGDAPIIEALGRPIDINDLVFNNAGDMVRAFGCSGFTVWGERAGGFGVLTTRNFDYPSTSPEMQAEHLLLVRHPNGRKQVLSITWPSFIGAFTGVNEDGVCAFMHDGTGGAIRQPDRKRTPVSIVIADVLERTSPAAATEDMGAALTGLRNYPFSYMVRLATPRVKGSPPAHVFRIDKLGVSQNPAGESSCITTNHYLDRYRRPMAQANEWSLLRYERIEQQLSSAVTRETAWETQDAVASENQAFPTLHTLIVFPEKRMIDLAFARWENGNVIPATRNEPTTIRFEELFASHK